MLVNNGRTMLFINVKVSKKNYKYFNLFNYITQIHKLWKFQNILQAHVPVN